VDGPYDSGCVKIYTILASEKVYTRPAETTATQFVVFGPLVAVI